MGVFFQTVDHYFYIMLLSSYPLILINYSFAPSLLSRCISLSLKKGLRPRLFFFSPLVSVEVPSSCETFFFFFNPGGGGFVV